MPRCLIIVLLTFAVFVSGCDAAGDGDQAHPERRAGGAMTVFDRTSRAFSTPAPNLSEEAQERHKDGDQAFEDVFVTAPAEVNGGLGPVFNDVSCESCHTGDGRAQGALLLHLSSANRTNQHGGPAPVDGFGLQLQDHAVFGTEPEARVDVSYETVTGEFADGTSYELRAPTYHVRDAYAPWPAHAQFSPRTPRPVFGVGLLEAVPAATLQRLADPQDADGDGISGETNRVWDKKQRRMRPGRFGWKADRPSVRQQASDAYHQDMGVTTPLLPDESGLGQPGHTDTLDDDPELPVEVIERTTFYVQTLGVPARRNLDDAQVQRGEDLFREIECASCHTPKLQTGSLDGVPAVADQTIYPYTDLLVHDMGAGLTDGRPVFRASGREWRTPPLWGIGLSRVVNGETHFLHDGRARDLAEAILWHGGEAQSARDQFKKLSKDERDDLLAFLHSL